MGKYKVKVTGCEAKREEGVSFLGRAMLEALDSYMREYANVLVENIVISRRFLYVRLEP